MRFRLLLVAALLLGCGLIGWLSRPDDAPQLAAAEERAAVPVLRGLDRSEGDGTTAGDAAQDTRATREPLPTPAAAASEEREREWGKLVVAVLVDGVPELPIVFVRIDGRSLAPLELEEDDDHSLLRIRVPTEDRGTHVVRVRSRASLPAETSVSVDRPGVVDLRTGGRIDVQHGLPADGKMSLRLERWEGQWVGAESPGDLAGLSLLTAVSLETSAFIGLADGRYRVSDDLSGLASEPVEVVAGRTAVAPLDLSTLVDVRGRVDAPLGSELRAARILVEGPSRAHVGAPTRGMEVGGRLVAAEGTFSLRARRGDTLRLTVVHPHLRTASSGGTVDVIAGRDGPPVLRLVEGPEIRFRIDGATWSSTPRPDAIFVHQMTVVLRREEGADDAIPLRVQPLVERGVVRVGVPHPGRWRVLIDPPAAAPLVRLADVGEGVTDLGTITLPRGSAIRCLGLPAQISTSWFAYVTARADTPAPYQRHAGFAPRGGETCLRGFAAGTVTVRLQSGPSETLCERTVVVDGVHDVDVDLAPPEPPR